MLHHPHRHLDELLDLDDQHSATWEAAYQRCRDLHDHPPDYYGELPPPVEEPFEDPEEVEEEVLRGELEEMARELPNRPLDVQDIDILGRRAIDVTMDWSAFVGKYTGLSVDYWKDLKAENEVNLDVEDISDSVVDRLSPEQLLIYNLFMDLAHSYSHSQSQSQGQPVQHRQVLLSVDGQGGTGKSFIIKLISSHIQQLPHIPKGFVVRAALTGVAGNNITGSTLHSLLRLPVTRGPLNPLSPTELNAIRNRLAGIQILIIDEKSIVSLRLLNMVDKRLRQVYPERHLDWFGGCSVMLLGDFFQLPPVADRALYTTGDLRSPEEISGRAACYQFNQTVELTVVQRQQGDEQAPFRKALEGLRKNNPSLEDWALLCTRIRSRLTLEDVESFANAIRIYPTNELVRNYNFDHLAALEQPAIQVISFNTGCAEAAKATSDQAGNLHARFPLMMCARVMLTENVWTPVGLVNGALGTIRDFGWPQSADVYKDLPFVILIEFDEYTGPPFEWQDHSFNNKTVPIFTSTRDFQMGNKACQRTQFPLTIAHAITVHKSQGISVDKAAMDISTRDFSLGLTYVAVSRVRTLQDVMFDTAFDLSSLRTRSREGVLAREADQTRRNSEKLRPPQ